MMNIQNQLVGAAIGQPITLECSLEAFPRPINYWKFKNGSIIATGEFIDIYKIRIVYQVTILGATQSHNGTYWHAERKYDIIYMKFHLIYLFQPNGRNEVIIGSRRPY